MRVFQVTPTFPTLCLLFANVVIFFHQPYSQTRLWHYGRDLNQVQKGKAGLNLGIGFSLSFNNRPGLIGAWVRPPPRRRIPRRLDASMPRCEAHGAHGGAPGPPGGRGAEVGGGGGPGEVGGGGGLGAEGGGGREGSRAAVKMVDGVKPARKIFRLKNLRVPSRSRTQVVFVSCRGLGRGLGYPGGHRVVSGVIQTPGVDGERALCDPLAREVNLNTDKEGHLLMGYVGFSCYMSN